MSKYTKCDIDTACMLLSGRACGIGLAIGWELLTGRHPWPNAPKIYRLAQDAFDAVYMEGEEGEYIVGEIIAAEAEARLRCGWLP